jgi:hypothetical protein
MRPHEWHEHDDEADERRYFRATKFGDRWTVITTLKSEPAWNTMNPITLPVLEALRTQLGNKYQRRRIPYEDYVTVDAMVVAAGGEAELPENK